MRAPAFFWTRPGLASTLLAPFGVVYGAIAAARMRQAGERAELPVICVGNPTLGGAGKTPTALALAHLLTAMDERPGFVTRGYGGEEAGPLLVDAERHDAVTVGDEPLLLARAFLTVVARNRVKGARMAANAGASVIVLDDGFQNPALGKDLALLVVDAARGVGNGRVFPAGPLRAPLAAQMEHAHALVRIGEGTAEAPAVKAADRARLPLLNARLEPDAASAAQLAGRKVLAFAGIGHPEKFFATLETIGAKVSERRAFADHHRFAGSEARELVRTARMRGLLPVTTEKDFVRLRGDPGLAELMGMTHTLPVRLRFDDEELMRDLLARAVATARRHVQGVRRSG